MSNILLLGDSITFGAWDEKGGWADRIKKEAILQNLQNSFHPYYEIYNLGIPGNTSKDLRDRFDTEVARRITSITDKIIVEIGINDSQKILSKNKHKISQQNFQENIEKIIENSRDFTEKLLFVGLTPIDNINIKKEENFLIDSEYRNEYAKIYNSLLQEITTKYNVAFIDVFSIFTNKMQNENLFSKDGIHPNSHGHQLLFEIIRTHIFS